MKKIGLFLLFLVLSIVSIAAQEKYALVIGNGKYDGITKLNNPENDAADMKAIRTAARQPGLGQKR